MDHRPNVKLILIKLLEENIVLSLYGLGSDKIS